ncbi:MAG: SusD/RagB family nutrient-binding outer membrane lipoprotein [Bacteroidia bacterium]|nr:SusD/RagB family nutrient-binding outer membrane lipoprotein [Bacteroidia bacterium]
MKNRRLVNILAFIMLIITISSCAKWIDTGINNDPNKPVDVPMNLLLPSIQVGMAYDVGGDLCRATSIWMQQIAGVDQQSSDIDKYILKESDEENSWKYLMYAGCLMDTKTLMTKANQQNSPYYKGIAEVLMAYGIGTMTDLYGDVPYTEAWQGDGNLKPKFDSQQSVYVSIQALLDSAIVDLGKPSSANNFLPGSEDLFYGGVTANWIKAAGALKARYYLHLAKVDANAYTNALNALTANGFASTTDDMTFNFGTAQNEANPQNQFLAERPGYIASAEAMVNALVASNDPRLPQLVDTAGGAVGSPAGNPNIAASGIGPFFTSINSPVPFITYAEQNFIKAECRFKTGDAAGAATAFNTAVSASLAQMGVSDAAWEAVNASETAASITLDKIMTQKWIALFMNTESFTDWRRTGLPALTPAANAQTSNQLIPRKFPYSISERLYNTANYNAAVTSQGWGANGGADIIQRVWWDPAQ